MIPPCSLHLPVPQTGVADPAVGIAPGQESMSTVSAAYAGSLSPWLYPLRNCKKALDRIISAGRIRFLRFADGSGFLAIVCFAGLILLMISLPVAQFFKILCQRGLIN